MGHSLPRREIGRLEDLDAVLTAGEPLAGLVLTGLDLRGREPALAGADLRGAILLGCRLAPRGAADATSRGALVFPEVPDLPFDLWRGALYTADELYAGLGPGAAHGLAGTPDHAIHRWWLSQRRGDGFAALAQRIHDHAIDTALAELIARHAVVGVMGGHEIRRGEREYARVALLGRALAEAGFLVATGGGPGAMEAANLGASLAGRPADALADALAGLAAVPDYRGPGGGPAAWVATGLATRARHPPLPEALSLGVPTWFYGHEPTNPFATHIAKYFANSLREDGLLTIADAGVIFTPGRAGTVQEVFEDATQNYYGTGPADPAPMVLLGAEHWTRKLPVAPLLEALFADHPARPLVRVLDRPAEAVAFLVEARRAAGRVS